MKRIELEMNPHKTLWYLKERPLLVNEGNREEPEAEGERKF